MNSQSTHHSQESSRSIGEMDILNQSEAIFQFATEGVLITDNTGSIVKINPSAEHLFGYQANELIGNPIETLIPRQYRKEHTQHRIGFVKNPHARCMGAGVDLMAQRKDGSTFPVEVSLSPYTNSKGKYTIAFIIDITTRKEAERQLIANQSELEKEVEERTLILKEAIQKLERTKDELDKALKREREVNSMKSRFISIASHEFRTPLATVLSSLSLVEKYANMHDIEKRDKHIHRIKNSVRNLTDILNDFLSLNKLEEGKVVVSVEDFCFHNFLDETLQEMQGIARNGQKIKKICHTDDSRGSYYVTLDRKLLKHIFMNLLSNAIKFSPENSTIEVSSEIQEEQLLFLVKDRGIGIPQADQKHLFERFFRSSNAGEIQGTGLGLSIVAQYVHLMNGIISFKSAENKGTEFLIQLPRRLNDSSVSKMKELLA
jgi:PAS domain S-box-containing protein